MSESVNLTEMPAEKAAQEMARMILAAFAEAWGAESTVIVYATPTRRVTVRIEGEEL